MGSYTYWYAHTYVTHIASSMGRDICVCVFGDVCVVVGYVVEDELLELLVHCWYLVL